jgi:hypothetical protein
MAITVLRNQSARDIHWQQPTYLYRKFKFNDVDVTSTTPKVYLGVLPANCLPGETEVRINTTFDKDFQIGTTVSAAAIASSFDFVRGTTGTYAVDRFAGSVTTTDLPVYIQFQSSAATIGEAEIWLNFKSAR